MNFSTQPLKSLLRFSLPGLLAGLTLTLPLVSFGQCGGGPAYDQTIYTKSQISVFTDLQYSSNLTSTNRTLDLYLPPSGSCKTRPLVMILHDGIFETNGDDKSHFPYVHQSYTLARKGYIVACMNYRTYFCGQLACANNACSPTRYCLPNSSCQILTETNSILNTYVSDIAWYKALQDANAAVKFTIGALWRDREITVSDVLMFGKGAGATTAMMLAFASQQEIDSYNQNLNTMQLGDLNAHVQTPFSQQTYSVKAVSAIAGGLPDLSFLNNSSGKYLYLFHGTCDKLYPICESGCNAPRTIYGSFKIREYITIQGIQTNEICYRLNVYEDFDHQLELKENHMMSKTRQFFSEVLTGTAACSVYEPCPSTLAPNCSLQNQCSCTF